jgi:cell division GTPase FtsZ
MVQPIGRASWADAVRCFLEPLSVFGLIGVDPREVHGLVRPRSALLHLWDDPWLDTSLREAREVLVSCRLRPTATLREIDEAATRVRRATEARLVLAGPEVGADEGPRAVAAVFL